MCDPVLLAIAGTAQATAQVANIGMGLYQGKVDEDVAKFNARQQENQAVRTREAGTDEENALREEAARKVSRQRVQLAAGGVDVNAGSAYDLQESTLLESEADALRIRRNTEAQAQVLEEGARLTLLTGRNARKLSYIKGIAGLASGTAKTVGSFV